MALRQRDIGGNIARAFGEGLFGPNDEALSLAQKRAMIREEQQRNEAGIEKLNEFYQPQQPSTLQGTLTPPRPQEGEGSLYKSPSPRRERMRAEQVPQQQQIPQEQASRYEPPRFLNPQQLKTQYEQYGEGPQGEALALQNNARTIAELAQSGRATKAQLKGLVAQHVPNKPIADSLNQAIDAHFQREERREEAFLKGNEPKLQELQKKISTLEGEDLRYGRMEQLLEDQSSFPSRFTAALFTKEGELSPLAQAGLSEDAQEFAKLLAESAAGAKDTFGSRVTNFDLQSYMKRFPGFLNSPEGRQRVLRDIQLVNQINRLEAEAINDVFNFAGGEDQISYAEAEKRAHKLVKEKVNELRKEYIHGYPSASQNKGRTIINDKNGKRLKSNGHSWEEVK